MQALVLLPRRCQSRSRLRGLHPSTSVVSSSLSIKKQLHKYPSNLLTAFDRLKWTVCLQIMLCVFCCIQIGFSLCSGIPMTKQWWKLQMTGGCQIWWVFVFLVVKDLLATELTGDSRIMFQCFQKWFHPFHASRVHICRFQYWKFFYKLFFISWWHPGNGPVYKIWDIVFVFHMHVLELFWSGCQCSRIMPKRFLICFIQTCIFFNRESRTSYNYPCVIEILKGEKICHINLKMCQVNFHYWKKVTLFIYCMIEQTLTHIELLSMIICWNVHVFRWSVLCMYVCRYQCQPLHATWSTPIKKD